MRPLLAPCRCPAAPVPLPPEAPAFFRIDINAITPDTSAPPVPWVHPTLSVSDAGVAAARLAGALGGVSDAGPLTVAWSPRAYGMRRADASYLRDAAAVVEGAYIKAALYSGHSKLLTRHHLVVTGSTAAGVYLGEVWRKGLGRGRACCCAGWGARAHGCSHARKCARPHARARVCALTCARPHHPHAHRTDAPPILAGAPPTKVLHAAVIPGHILSWAHTWDQAAAAATTSTVLATDDGGYDGMWLWQSFTKEAHVPPAYLRMIANATELWVVRAEDADNCAKVSCCGERLDGAGHARAGAACRPSRMGARVQAPTFARVHVHACAWAHTHIHTCAIGGL